jgi:hypothetical protein
MDQTTASLLAPLITAICTAILMYAAYNWPSGRNRRDDKEDRPKGKHQKDEDS